MNYEETINYLFTRLPMYSRIGQLAYKADLTNTIKLCHFLGDPQLSFKSIHVAGTNGKGSVSHMLAAIFQTAGYKTGLYTSPHLNDFRERIKVNGEMIDESFIITFTEKIKVLSEKIEPSFFEITVAMAFDYFAQQKTDIVIVETGLGGRLDSTNIITPELSVITNIGWDHMNILGDSLEKIAGEKAGIIKPGIPVVVGEVIPETKQVFEKAAKEKRADLSIATKKRQALNWYWVKHDLVVEVAQEHMTDHNVYQLDLTGIYQVKNLLTVLEACAILQKLGWKIDDKQVHKGLGQVKKLTGLHGRWEIIHHSPTIILDVAHNADGFRQLTQQVEVTDHSELHIVLGMVKDKEVEKALQVLPRNADYYFTKAHIPRALSETELSEKAKAIGLNGTTWPEVNSAIRSAIDHADPRDLILVCGSVFLIGEVHEVK